MERPSKRLRLSYDNAKPARPVGSTKSNDLEGSQMGTRLQSSQSDAEEDDPSYVEMNAYSPQHMYHRHDFDRDMRERRQRLGRRAGSERLNGRSPRKTTLNIVDVIIDEADNAVAALTLPERPAVVTIGTYGAVTVEPSETGTPAPKPVVSGSELTPTSQSTLSPPPPAPSPSTSPPSTTGAAATGSPSLSHSIATILQTTISVVGGNHTTTTITESSDTTTTSTSTSTLELSFVNGTIVTVHPSTSFTSSFSSNTTTTRSTITSSSSTQSSSSSTRESSSSPSASAGSSTIPSPTDSSPSSATSSSSSSGGGGGGGGPSTPTVVGSIIGGIAGLAIILLLLLFLIRQYRRRLKARNALPAASSTDPTASGPAAAEVSPRSSGHTPLAAAVTPAFLSKWRHSGQTTTSEATSDTGERGFQKLGGRKIASVLQSGGDQYGGNYGAFEKDAASSEPSGRSGPGAGNLSGASFYRDSAGFYGGDGSQPGTPIPSSVDVPGPSQARDFAGPSEGVAVMRPSPARTPVTSTGGILRPTGSNPSTPRERSRDPASAGDGGRVGPDALGRSLASFDGSRGSKFTESV